MTINGFYEEVIVAGFGGQGIILAGKLLAQTAMDNGMEVTYMPSYGAEMRGGTSNCMVVMSDEPIASPLVDRPNSLIAMNKASFNKFLPRIKPKGLLIMNSSLVSADNNVRNDIEVVAIPADKIAVDLSSPKSANMVVIGAYLQKLGCLSVESAAENLSKVLAKCYHKTLAVNIEAIKKGAEFAKAHSNTKIS